MAARMGGYSTAEITRLLHVPRARVYSLVHSGVVAPRRGHRHDYRFSFADLVVLRTARDLASAGVPPQRVCRSLGHLQQQLPAGRPLTALRLVASGHRVIVQDGPHRRDAETDQLLLDFGTPEPRIVAALPPPAPLADDHDDGGLAAGDWYEIGSELEAVAPEDAIEAYLQALEIDDSHADAHINLGRLLHERGDVAAAERHYRSALQLRVNDVTARYNLGVALEDLGRLPDARRAYQEVVLADPRHADAFFNLAGVLERLGRKGEALRYLKTYRELIADDRNGRGQGG